MLEYCPFEIDADQDKFDLVTVSTETAYGSLVSRVSRKHVSKVGTVYIHGIAADWSTWTPMLAAEASMASDPHDKIIVDLPGFGDSENRLDRLDLAGVGEAILATASSLGYRKIRIVGHSLGGFMALDMASRNPDRIISLHLAAGPFYSILATLQHPIASILQWPQTAITFEVQYLLAMTGRFGTTFLRFINRLGLFRWLLSPAATHPKQLKESVVKALLSQHNPQGFLLMAANAAGYDPKSQWSKVRCPILATFGESDVLVGARDMMRFLQDQPNAKSTLISDSSHLHHIERPIEVAKALQLWTRA